MKYFLIISLSFFSTLTLANNKLAEKLVIKEIETYASDYQVEELESIKYLGIVNKKYLFSVQYTKNFCIDVGDDERDYCATYRCASPAEVDSDAVVSFESEDHAKACTKVPGTDYTRGW